MATLALLTVPGFRVSVAEPAEVEPVSTVAQGVSLGKGQAFGMPFKLPPAARQGDGTWYLIRIDATVEAKRTSRGGVATLAADIDGLATNLVELWVKPGAERCLQTLTWATVDLLVGSRQRSTCGYRTSFVSANFAQQRAIRGGARLLRISVDDSRGVLVGVKVRPGSGVYLTDAGPADLRIEVDDGAADFDMGEWSKIGVSIVNVGQRPARATRVRVEAASTVDVKRRSVGVRPRIGPGDSAEASFWVRPEDTNPIRMGIVAEAHTARAATEVLVEPSGPEGSASSVGHISFLVALVGVALLAAGAFLAKRRSPQA